MKQEPSWLIPQKHAASSALLIAVKFTPYTLHVQ